MELRDILKDNSDSIVFARHAEQLAREGDVEGAETVLRKGIERHPRYAAGHAVLASILMQKGDKEQAGRELERAVSLDPGNPNDHLSLGKYYINVGRGEAAVNVMAVVKRFEPDNVAVDDFCRKAEVVKASKADLELDSQSKQAISALVDEEEPVPTMVQAAPEQAVEEDDTGDGIAETQVLQPEEDAAIGADGDDLDLPEMDFDAVADAAPDDSDVAEAVIDEDDIDTADQSPAEAMSEDIPETEHMDDVLTEEPADIEKPLADFSEPPAPVMEDTEEIEDIGAMEPPETELSSSGGSLDAVEDEPSAVEATQEGSDADDVIAAFTCDEEPELLDDDAFDDLIKDGADDVSDVEDEPDDSATEDSLVDDGNFEEDVTEDIEVFSDRGVATETLEEVNDDEFDALLGGNDGVDTEAGDEAEDADDTLNAAAESVQEDSGEEQIDVEEDLPSFEEEVAGLGEERPVNEPVGAGSGDRPEIVGVHDVDENGEFDIGGISLVEDEPVLTSEERAELEALNAEQAESVKEFDLTSEQPAFEPEETLDGPADIAVDEAGDGGDEFISELSKEELEVLSDTNTVEAEDVALTHETREGIDYSDVLENMGVADDIEDALDEAQGHVPEQSSALDDESAVETSDEIGTVEEDMPTDEGSVFAEAGEEPEITVEADSVVETAVSAVESAADDVVLSDDDTALPDDAEDVDVAAPDTADESADAIIDEFTGADSGIDSDEEPVVAEDVAEETSDAVTDADEQIDASDVGDFDMPGPGTPIHGVEIGPDDELTADDMGIADELDDLDAVDEMESAGGEDDLPDEESTRFVEDIIKNAPGVDFTDDESVVETVDTADDDSLDDLISAYELTLESDEAPESTGYVTDVAVTAEDTGMVADTGPDVESPPSAAAGNGVGGEETATMAEIYVSQGLIEEAIRIYGAIVARQPDNEKAFNRLRELREKLDEDAED